MDVREKYVMQKVNKKRKSICPNCIHHNICIAENNQPCFECNRFIDAIGVTVQQWISVKDRLPELHTKVLCCGIKGGRFIAELGTWGHEKHLYWDKKNGQGSPTVTHWMPLPEPPKGE